MTSRRYNPSGITTSESRRAAIVDIAKRWSKASHLHVIADEAYRELRYWGDDLADEHPEKVKKLKTLLSAWNSELIAPLWSYGKQQGKRGKKRGNPRHE
jgi:DNA-binding transcriptional MocR family regulator